MTDDHVYPVGQPPAGRRPPYYLTAYGIACDHGFQGTVEEWLDSLVGPQGPAGKNAFEYAKEGGYEGSEEGFRQRMAVSGKTAYEYALDGGYPGTVEDFYEDLGALQKPIPIFRGGHGKTTAEEGLEALGGLAKKGGAMEGPLRVTEPTDPMHAATKKSVDEVLKEIERVKAAVASVTVTLPASGWSNSAPYVQAITVEGMKADWIPGDFKSIPTGVAETDITIRSEMNYISSIASGDGTLTFKCLEDKPTVNMTLRVSGVLA